ncbi:MAG: hypothetical protein AAGA48_18810 [Myxococcota bacterium]
MEHLHKTLSALPERNLTVRLLELTGKLVDQSWSNPRDLAGLIRDVTGEEEESYLQEIGERAITLFADPDERYQRAIRAYRLVDDVDKLVGTASFLDQVAQRVSFLSFLDRLIPKPETMQAVDAGAKLLAELVGFTSVNGLPGDSVSDFAKSLANSAHEDRLRLTCWVVADGVLPFGPDFVQLVVDRVGSASLDDLEQSTLFRQVRGLLPGGENAQKLMVSTLEGAGDWIGSVLRDRGLDQNSIGTALQDILDVGEGSFDVMAAAIDVGTNYFEHTGTQSVARQVVRRAYGEV